jgi:hypothetical protein
MAVRIVDDHRAGPADPLAAAYTRGKTQMLSEKIEHHELFRYVHRADLVAIDSERKRAGRDAHARSPRIFSAVIGNS